MGSSAAVEASSAELLFRHKVIACLQDEGLLSDERLELLLSWRHTGFSVHSSRGTRGARTPSDRRHAQRVKNGVTVEPGDGAGVERLARYLLRPPLSLERMRFDETGTVLYRRKAQSHFGCLEAAFDPMDFLARLLMHIPQPRLHTVRYYGEYSSVVRARRRAKSGGFETGRSRGPASADADSPSAAERRRLRRAWAELIRRIYEVDPISCQCGARMRILAFILDPQDITRILQHIDTEGATNQHAPLSLPSGCVRSNCRAILLPQPGR